MKADYLQYCKEPVGFLMLAFLIVKSTTCNAFNGTCYVIKTWIVINLSP